ncbi:hypothetical protein CDAR_250611 [Caerostris darwini]|uniref:Uncharacterized protein n=1 Tax=Caerostris darwini TaxID=1538125 RepID=A0AAV4RUS6_9ARAC|nr:hypothetical protein CDAR_250611 [Caerostris darwini]
MKQESKNAVKQFSPAVLKAILNLQKYNDIFLNNIQKYLDNQFRVVHKILNSSTRPDSRKNMEGEILKRLAKGKMLKSGIQLKAAKEGRLSKVTKKISQNKPKRVRDPVQLKRAVSTRKQKIKDPNSNYSGHNNKASKVANKKDNPTMKPPTALEKLEDNLKTIE